MRRASKRYNIQHQVIEESYPSRSHTDKRGDVEHDQERVLVFLLEEDSIYVSQAKPNHEGVKYKTEGVCCHDRTHFVVGSHYAAIQLFHWSLKTHF